MTVTMNLPTKESFLSIAKEGDIIPIYREFSAALETPLSAYLKIRKGPYSFLLESVEKGQQVGRYSFIGSDPYLVFSAKDGVVTITERGEERRVKTSDPLVQLEEIFKRHTPVEIPGLSGFSGGAVGYLGYEMVRYFERLPSHFGKAELDLPDCVFMFSDIVLIYDHVRQIIRAIVNTKVGADPFSDYREAIKRLDSLGEMLRIPIVPEDSLLGSVMNQETKVLPNMSQEQFEEKVILAKEHITNGDIFQVVLSRRLAFELKEDPLAIYCKLRAINPSPYMFYLDMGDLKLVGSSPEILVKVHGREVEVKPIAGTRPRGLDQNTEAILEQELLNDEKEKAEHLMLVDLGRNDIGRVCKYGSVRVEEFMRVEKYSHVMHLVSQVKGELSEGISNFDVLRACFPAGTVSGAPKIRAMEIIGELEPTLRGPYAGTVGYLGYSGDMDTCITIRTIMINKDKAFIQAGAGIVADSDPAREFIETNNKTRAMLKALGIDEGGC